MRNRKQVKGRGGGRGKGDGDKGVMRKVRFEKRVKHGK